ncbi:MAG: CoA pyrophosphatase, partial [Chloroflexi bacterium]|nr:CoA pyrophosphatase [Chloroflexota bacterium]
CRHLPARQAIRRPVARFDWGDRPTDGLTDGKVPACPPSTGPALLPRLHEALLIAGLGLTGSQLPPAPDPDGRTHAAALVLLYPCAVPAGAEPAPYLVLTRRPTTLRRHAGQISLPGGRYEPEDGSLLRAALRETQEELGVDPARLMVWGRLDPELITVSHYLLAPFVAYTSRRPRFQPSSDEVAEVIDVPLALFLDPANVDEEIWTLPTGMRRVAFYRYGEHKIWGATARVLSQIAALLEPSLPHPQLFLGAAGEGAARPSR